MPTFTTDKQKISTIRNDNRSRTVQKDGNVLNANKPK